MAKEIDLGNLIEQQGGEFRLTAICQKRMKELARGARPLVDVPRGPVNILDVVLAELEAGLIEPIEGSTMRVEEEIVVLDLDVDE